MRWHPDDYCLNSYYVPIPCHTVLRRDKKQASMLDIIIRSHQASRAASTLTTMNPFFHVVFARQRRHFIALVARTICVLELKGSTQRKPKTLQEMKGWANCQSILLKSPTTTARKSNGCIILPLTAATTLATGLRLMDKSGPTNVRCKQQRHCRVLFVVVLAKS